MRRGHAAHRRVDDRADRLGLNASSISALVGSQLQTVAPTLDSVLNSLTGVLGVHLGQADTRVGGVRCGVPALVA